MPEKSFKQLITENIETELDVVRDLRDKAWSDKPAQATYSIAIAKLHQALVDLHTL